MAGLDLDAIRLSPIEKQALAEAIEGVDGEIYAFGSRVTKGTKGGAIDLLVIPTSSASFPRPAGSPPSPQK